MGERDFIDTWTPPAGSPSPSPPDAPRALEWIDQWQPPPAPRQPLQFIDDWQPRLDIKDPYGGITRWDFISPHEARERLRLIGQRGSAISLIGGGRVFPGGDYEPQPVAWRRLLIEHRLRRIAAQGPQASSEPLGPLNLLEPRRAHAVVIPADAATWTLTGTDAERFRQSVGQMIRQAQPPPERQPAPPPDPPPDDRGQYPARMPSPEVIESSEGYTLEELRAREDAEDELERLHREQQ